MAGAGLGRDATDPPPRVPAECPRPPQPPAPPSPGSILSERGDGGSRAISLAMSPSLGPRLQGREQRDQNKGSEGGSWPHTGTCPPPTGRGSKWPTAHQTYRDSGPKIKLAPASVHRRAGPGLRLPCPERRLGAGVRSHHRQKTWGWHPHSDGHRHTCVSTGQLFSKVDG